MYISDLPKKTKMKNKNISASFLQKNRERIGIIIKDNREAKGYTIEELSEKAQIPPRTIERLENGHFCANVDLLAVLGVYLDMKLNFHSTIHQ